MVTSKGRKDLYQGASSRGRCHCPRPRGGPLLTRTAAGGPLTLAGRSGSASSGVTAPCPGGLVRARFCLCPPRVGAWSPQACGSPVMKSHWPSRSHFLRIPSPFARSPCWEAWPGGLEPSQQWENFFGLTVLQFVSCPCGRCEIWFYHPCAPPTISLWLFLCFWIWGISFCWVPASSTASCDFGALAGGDELISFFRTIVNWKPPKFVFKCGQVLRCTKD